MVRMALNLLEAICHAVPKRCDPVVSKWFNPCQASEFDAWYESGDNVATEDWQSAIRHPMRWSVPVAVCCLFWMMPK